MVKLFSLAIKHIALHYYFLLYYYPAAYTLTDQPSDHEKLLAQGKGSCNSCVTAVATCVLILLTEVQMHELTQVVIPNIMAKWEALAYCMRYKLSDVEAFRVASWDIKECCNKLFVNWITTNHDPQPKTYQALLNYIDKVDDLAAASQAIKKELIQGMLEQTI